MSRHTPPKVGRTTALLGAQLHELLESPLEFLMLQQVRQRALYVMMRQAAANGCLSVDHAKCILTMLEHDLALHRTDEQYDLFPALKRRATAEDNIDELINALDSSEMGLERVKIQVMQALSTPADNGIIRLPPREASLILSYAIGQQRRLAIAHGILMVLARKRLTANDLEVMSASMKSRRGVTA